MTGGPRPTRRPRPTASLEGPKDRLQRLSGLAGHDLRRYDPPLQPNFYGPLGFGLKTISFLARRDSAPKAGRTATDAMPSTTRTFLALAVPETLTPRLARLRSRLAAAAPGARWTVTPPDHVTLAFLGEVDVVDLNNLCRAVAEAASTFTRFELRLKGLGAFPDVDKPRAVWAGVEGPGLETLRTLQAALSRTVADLGYPADLSPFRPHVTLGRFPPGRRRKPAASGTADGRPGPDPDQHEGRDLAAAFKHHQTWHAGPFAVTEVVAYASPPPGQSGPYAPLGRARLKK